MITFLTFSLLLLSSVQAGIIMGTPYEFCPTSGVHEYLSTEITSTAPSFNWTNTYTEAPFKQSQTLAVKAGDGTNNFKFSLYGKRGTISNERQCAGSKNLFFIRLINNYLFLIDSSSDTYYVCKFDTSSTVSITPYVLSTAGTINNLDKFVPYLVTETKIYCLASNQTQSRVAEFTWTPGTMTGVVSTPPILTPNIEPLGTELFVYNKDSRLFMTPSSNNQTWNVLALATSIAPTDYIQGYPMANKNTVIVVMPQSLLNSTSYHIFGSVLDYSLGTSEISSYPIVFYCDYLYNHFRVHSVRYHWITVSTKTPGVYYYTIFDNPRKGNVASVGLSQNKAVVYYTSGEVEYYRHESSGNITKFPSMRVANTLDWTFSKFYFISANCLCQNLKKLNCFSGTLNCVLTTKAYSTCIQNYSTYQTW